MRHNQSSPDRGAQYDALKGRSSTVGLLLAQGKRPAEVDAVGTIFVVLLEGQPYLVTALHCLDYYEPGEMCFVRFANTVLPLNGTSFIPSRQADLAVAWFDWKGAVRRGLEMGFGKSCPDDYIVEVAGLVENAINIDTDITGVVADFGLVGYPESRNRLHSHANGRSTHPHQFGMTLELQGVTRSKAGEIERLLFAYDRKAPRMPAPRGLSGSPVFGLSRGPGEQGYRSTLWGVAIEHTRSDRLLEALHIGELVNLLNHMSEIVGAAIRSVHRDQISSHP